MNFTNVKVAGVAGVAGAVVGFVFAGAYAAAGHDPERTAQVTRPSQPPDVRVVDRSVPEASEVFVNSTAAPVEHPATF